MTRVLLEKGCNVEDEDAYGRTALHRAVKYGRMENIIFLCKNGANINSKDNAGITPLHTLIYSYKDLDSCIKRNLITEDLSDTLLSKRNVEIIADLLISLGADVNALTEDANTILETAVLSKPVGAEQFVLKLLAKLEFFGQLISKTLRNKIRTNKKYKMFHKKCLAELSVIKDYVFYGSAKLLPIILGHQKTIADYVKNVNLIEAFNAIQFSEVFPIYGELIKRRFSLGESRHLLREDSAQFLGTILPKDMKIELIIQKIISHLSDKDLIEFMKEGDKYIFVKTTNGVYVKKPWEIRAKNN